MTPPKKNGHSRTSRGLRDILFDEIDELRSGEGDPPKALAVAKLAQQIMSTVRVEMEFHKLRENSAKLTEKTIDPVELGVLELGSARGAEKPVTGH